MDFNRLYSEHQALLMQADRAPDDGARRTLESAASRIAQCIGNKQRALGARAARGWETLAAPARSTLVSPGRHGQGYAS